MSAVQARHRPFFAPDLVIFLVQSGGLRARQLALGHFVPDAQVLPHEAIIDLIPSRVGEPTSGS